MKKSGLYLLVTLLVLPLLAACSALNAFGASAPTATPTRTTGGRGNFGTRTPTLTATPAPTDTPVPTDTPTPTFTPIPTNTRVPTSTGLPLSAYDVRVTITNDTPNPIEYTFIGPVDAPAQVSVYLSILNGQTGFLHLPHGRYSVVITTAGKTTQVSYNIAAGVYSCWLSKGCEAFN